MLRVEVLISWQHRSLNHQVIQHIKQQCFALQVKAASLRHASRSPSTFAPIKPSRAASTQSSTSGAVQSIMDAWQCKLNTRLGLNSIEHEVSDCFCHLVFPLSSCNSHSGWLSHFMEVPVSVHFCCPCEQDSIGMLSFR